MPARSDAATLATTAVVVAAVDQLTKSLIVSAIGPGSADSVVRIAGPWLSLEYAENRGAAFGVLPALGSILPLVSVLVVAALLLHYAREDAPHLWETLAIGAICGGAAGNLIDRLRLGYVVDFISVGRWPNFNVADSAITLGAATLIWVWIHTDGRSGVTSTG